MSDISYIVVTCTDCGRRHISHPILTARCVYCGASKAVNATPPADDSDDETSVDWRPSEDTLRAARQLFPGEFK